MVSATTKNTRSYNRGAAEWAKTISARPGHIYLEKPAMEKELPRSLRGKSVLCIGVGAGDEISAILKKKPKEVVGIDTAEKLLAITAEKHPSIQLRRMDMMRLLFPHKTFDLVYSSLTFHYANDWDALLVGIHRVMRRGGTLLFSTHHPRFWLQKPATGKTYKNKRGVVLTEHTATLPAGKINITFYNHLKQEAIADALKHAGFTLSTFFAPQVIKLTERQLKRLKKEEREKYKKTKEINKRTPLFLVAKAIAL